MCDHSYAVPLGVTAFFVLPLVFALFAGRTFCAAVCPHGALQDLVLLKPVKVPPWLEQALSVLPYIYLGAGVLFAATGSAFIICQYDPFVPIFRMSGRSLMVLSGAALAPAGSVRGPALLPIPLSLWRAAQAGRHRRQMARARDARPLHPMPAVRGRPARSARCASRKPAPPARSP